METAAESQVPATLSESEHINAWYSWFLQGVFYFDDAETFKKLIAEARAEIPNFNIDQLGISSHLEDKNNGRTIETALGMAVRINNYPAVQVLLAEGASPLASKTRNGRAIIDEAVSNGDWEIVDALLKLKEGPTLIELRANSASHPEFQNLTLLHDVIFCLSPFSLIQHGQWESVDPNKVWEPKALKSQLICYYKDYKYKNITLPPALTVRYAGNQAVTEILLRHLSRLLTMKTTTVGNHPGFSPLDVVFNPHRYAKYFYDINGRNIRLDQGEDPHVLRFNADIGDCYSNKRAPVTVIFDFKGFRQQLERIANYHGYQLPILHDAHVKAHLAHVENQHQNLKQNVLVIEQNVVAISKTQQEHTQTLQAQDQTLQKHGSALETLSAQMQELLALIDKEHPCYKQIAALEPEAKRIFDYFYIDLYAKCAAFQVLSSKEIQRNKNKSLDYFSNVLSVVSTQLPSPFGAPLQIAAVATGMASDANEADRVKALKECLGTNVPAFVQTLAYRLTSLIQEHVAEGEGGGHSLADLKAAALKADAAKPYALINTLSAEVLKAAVQQIYNVRKLDIDMNLATEARSRIFLTEILAAVKIKLATRPKEWIVQCQQAQGQVQAAQSPTITHQYNNTTKNSSANNNNAIQIVQQANGLQGMKKEEPLKAKKKSCLVM